MDTVRLNITLPEDLAHQLDRLVGPRKKSRFITEALRQRIEKMENDQIQKRLKEGYKARKAESLAITKEFEPTDLEGWDEY
ncbi:MAG: ribbon-helix-helix protein, CopG family [Desulfobacterales bacterium]|nr:ribbon-helix-helix protein, CopG family [Desulfobacterales bacterium]